MEEETKSRGNRSDYYLNLSQLMTECHFSFNIYFQSLWWILNYQAHLGNWCLWVCLTGCSMIEDQNQPILVIKDKVWVTLLYSAMIHNDIIQVLNKIKKKLWCEISPAELIFFQYWYKKGNDCPEWRGWRREVSVDTDHWPVCVWSCHCGGLMYSVCCPVTSELH